MSWVVFAETVRRHVTSVAYLTFVALLAIVGLGMSRFDQPASIWPTLVTLLAFIVGCGPIGPEFSSGTLQLVLTKPLTRSSYLLSRVAGVVVVVWLAALVPFLFELVGRAVWSDALAAKRLVTALLNGAADVVLICCLLVLLGSVTRAYFNIAIYVAGMVGLGIVQGVLGMIRSSRSSAGRWLNEHAVVERGLAWVDANLYPSAPATLDVDWLLLVSSNAAIALVLACFAFRRREVPYGAD